MTPSILVLNPILYEEQAHTPFRAGCAPHTLTMDHGWFTEILRKLYESNKSSQLSNDDAAADRNLIAAVKQQSLLESKILVNEAPCLIFTILFITALNKVLTALNRLQMATLIRKVTERGLKIRRTKRDGNCQFRVFAKLLNWIFKTSTHDHKNVRQKINEWLEVNGDFHPNGESMTISQLFEPTIDKTWTVAYPYKQPLFNAIITTSPSPVP